MGINTVNKASYRKIGSRVKSFGGAEGSFLFDLNVLSTIA
jgi:hypothetical protein